MRNPAARSTGSRPKKPTSPIAVESNSSTVIAYEPPAGVVGQMIAKLFQREPRIQTRRDLHRFKQLMEAGEIATAARTRKMLAEEQD
jgi:uncharacterized membrane protein